MALSEHPNQPPFPRRADAELPEFARILGAKMSGQEANTPSAIHIFDAPSPVFDANDPTVPGHMGTVRVEVELEDAAVATEQEAAQPQRAEQPPINPQVEQEQPAEQPNVNQESNVSFFQQAMRARFAAAAGISTPQSATTNESTETMSTKPETQAAANEAGAAQQAAQAVKSAKESASKSNAFLKGLSIAGGVLGAGSVVGGVLWGLNSAKAAAAAANSAAATATTVEAATTVAAMTETVATAGAAAAETVVVAGEAAAASGVWATITGVATTNVAVVGVTMPLWGWAAAAVGAAALGYVIYRGVKRYRANKAQQPAASKEAANTANQSAPSADKGVSAAQAARAFGKGIVVGAVAAASILGTAALVGLLGAGMIGKATAVYGAKWGAVVAVGGAYLAFSMISSAINGLQLVLVRRQASKSNNAAATEASYAAAQPA